MAPIIIIFGIILADQAVKLLVRSKLALGQSVPVIHDFFNITYIRNTGTAFSMFENNLWITLGLTTVLIVVCLLFMLHEWKKGSKFLALCLAMILGGGLANMVDRVFIGYVTDMFAFGNFAVFNVADIFVCTGCALAIIAVFFGDRKKVK
jgi:signal peptidase II